MIGIIAAMKTEIDLLESRLTDVKYETVSGVEYKSGKMNGKDVVLAVCGIGKVFAAICAQTMILKYSPDLIINTGVGGALNPTLAVGDLCIATRVVQHDMDTSPIGDPVGLISGINMIYLPCDENICNDIKAIADENEINSTLGTVASGDQFVADKEKKNCIINNFAADACDMEGAAIGHVCYVNKVPFTVIRAISDGADNGAFMDYPTFVNFAAGRSSQIVATYVSKS